MKIESKSIRHLGQVVHASDFTQTKHIAIAHCAELPDKVLVQFIDGQQNLLFQDVFPMALWDKLNNDVQQSFLEASNSH